MSIFEKLQAAVDNISKKDEEKEDIIAGDVLFKYIQGPILHIQFLPGKVTEKVFKTFIENYKNIFDGKDEKFVLLFDLRHVYANSFNLEWIVEFIALLISLREQTAKFIKGTAIFLPENSDSIVDIMSMFFQLYKTVRPHFASYKQDEITAFIEKCLFS